MLGYYVSLTKCVGVSVLYKIVNFKLSSLTLLYTCICLGPSLESGSVGHGNVSRQHRIVGYWLAGCCGMIAGSVLIG